MTIRFLVDAWEDAEHDSPEICKTAGSLRIPIGQRSLTRNQDDWSQSVKQTTRVAAYPLAQWFAASWWRLMYEPLPMGGKPSTSWRMAHEMPAAGFGFLWPRIVFAPDGESLQIWSVPTRDESEQPVRYLTDWCGTVDLHCFATAVDDFMDLVLNRLEAVDLSESELRDIWKEIEEERADPALKEFRRMEAMLGFDPDEIDSGVVERFVKLRESIGKPASGEIAAACSSEDPIARLEKITEAVEMEGMLGKFSIPAIEEPAEDRGERPPWARGHELARNVREAMGLNGQAITGSQLSAMVELTPEEAFGENRCRERMPLGVAVRDRGDKVKFVLRKRNPAGRRFELARLICDHLLFGSKDNWLPATDTKTVRQKWQRAFAAEFLCPIDALTEWLDDDFSEDAVESAAGRFGVSERTVTSQLVNHRLLPALMLEEGSGMDGFPYQI
ncbi:MAG: ImmA/IrrE family metallo-endopeptidase [Candidatus Hydrogenedentota bacterium]